MDITLYHPFGLNFNGKSIYSNEGLGGSETAIIYVAYYLKKKGHAVRIYCVCNEPGIYDGVEYHNHYDINWNDTFEIFISVRDPAVFTNHHINSTVNALWLHDVCVENRSDSKLVRSNKQIDIIFTVSDWQKKDYAKRLHIHKNKFCVIRNGINPNFFKHHITKKKNKIIYSVKPTKGLDLTKKIIPKLLTQFPELEIHLFGYKTPWDNDSEYNDLKKYPQVKIRGSISQVELAKEMLESYLFIHPNNYPETSCISAFEAQIAGAPVISSKLGALPETVTHKKTGILIDKDTHSDEYVSEFVKAFSELYTNHNLWGKLANNAIKHGQKNTWSHVGKRFEQKIKQLNTQKSITKKIYNLFLQKRNQLVTIMMPTYNNEKYITTAIESVRKQTYPEWELIIINDGSTDKTEDIVKKYALKDARIKYYANTKNIGISKSRNKALQLAKGNYIGHLDSDDEIYSTTIEECMKVFRKDPTIKMIYTNYNFSDNEMKHSGVSKAKPFTKESLHDNFIWSHFGIYEKDTAKKVGGFNEKLVTCEDGELYLKIGEKYTIFHLDKELYNRRMHSESTVSKHLRNGCSECTVRAECPNYAIINRLREKYAVK